MGSESNKSANSGKEKTVEGCVVRQQTDYFIFPKKGQPLRASGQDLSAHVGHHVKVHGTEGNASGSMASSSGNTGGASGAAASGSMGQSASTGSTGAIGSSTSGTSGNTAGTAGESGTSGGASSASNKEIVVDRVDTISETCPANIQNRINSSGMGSSSNPSKPY